MKKILLTIICFFIGSTSFLKGKNKEKLPLPSAYVLIECRTGAVLNEHNSHERLNVGYLSKLMSLLIIAEDIDNNRYSLNTELTATQTVLDMKGSVVWLEPGDKMTVDELLKSVIVGNANDALAVLSDNSRGDTETFVRDMNTRAYDLGLRDTAFYSPYGFYDEREYTTAYDMAVICRELWKYDFLYPYFKIWRDFVDNEQVELVNENTLSRTYQRHCGFKASHSEQSGYCIAECGSSEDGTAYIAIVLGAENEEISFGNAKQLINSGFSDYKVTDSYFPDEMIKPVKVKNGSESAVELELINQGNIVVPRGTSKLSMVSVIPDYLEAPLSKGDKVGCAAVYNGKKLIFETDIIVKNDVEKLNFPFLLRKVLLNITE